MLNLNTAYEELNIEDQLKMVVHYARLLLDSVVIDLEQENQLEREIGGFNELEPRGELCENDLAYFRTLKNKAIAQNLESEELDDLYYLCDAEANFSPYFAILKLKALVNS